MGADTVRLPNGKTMTLGRAKALGLADANGVLTAKGQAYGDTRGDKERERQERDDEWRATQGLPPRRIEPLRPRNVDNDGNAIEDPDTLAAIAERTAKIEAGEFGPAVVVGRFTGVGSVTPPEVPAASTEVESTDADISALEAEAEDILGDDVSFEAAEDGNGSE